MVMMQLRLMLVMRRTVKMPVVRMLAVDLSQETREATRGDLPTPQPKNLSGRTLIIVSKPTEGDMMIIPSLPNKPKLTGGSSQLLNCATTFYYRFRSGGSAIKVFIITPLSGPLLRRVRVRRRRSPVWRRWCPTTRPRSAGWSTRWRPRGRCTSQNWQSSQRGSYIIVLV